MLRKSSAIWQGTGAEGKGTLSSTSKVLSNTPYSFTSRFKSEDGTAGTNPEELIAAAHAGCFTMATSFQLSKAGFTPTELRTEAILTLENENGFVIKGIHLELVGEVPGVTEEQFIEFANTAKANCPVSKALAALPITLSAKLK
jgi:osmotically inducible protein OsmC